MGEPFYPNPGQELSMLNYVGTLTSITDFLHIRNDPEWQVFSRQPEFMRRLPWERFYVLDHLDNLRWNDEYLMESVVAGNAIARVILGLKYIFTPDHHDEGEELMLDVPNLRLKRYGLSIFHVYVALIREGKCFEAYTQGLQMMVDEREVYDLSAWAEERAVFVKAIQEVNYKFPNRGKLWYGLCHILLNLCGRLFCRSWVSEYASRSRGWIFEADGKEFCGPLCCAMYEAEKILKKVLFVRMTGDSPSSGPYD